MQLDRSDMAMSGWLESDRTIVMEPLPLPGEPSEPQIVTLLGLDLFKISNKLSTGDVHYANQLVKLGDTFKFMARTSSSWEGLLKAGTGSTSRSLIEQLFEISITGHDLSLVKLMLRFGADPNQQIYDRFLGTCVSALDYSLGRRKSDIADLLLNSGAVYCQTSLKHVIFAGDFATADHMLESDWSLHLDFNYLDDLDQHTISSLSHIKLETANLLGLVCLDIIGFQYCDCDVVMTGTTNVHAPGCKRYDIIVSLKYLLGKGAAITLDTMILASFGANVTTLKFLTQCGGNVRGFNCFGFSCLDAACLRKDLQYGVVSLLLYSGATMHSAFRHRPFIVFFHDMGQGISVQTITNLPESSTYLLIQVLISIFAFEASAHHSRRSMRTRNSYGLSPHSALHPSIPSHDLGLRAPWNLL